VRGSSCSNSSSSSSSSLVCLTLPCSLRSCTLVGLVYPWGSSSRSSQFSWHLACTLSCPCPVTLIKWSLTTKKAQVLSGQPAIHASLPGVQLLFDCYPDCYSFAAGVCVPPLLMVRLTCRWCSRCWMTGCNYSGTWGAAACTGAHFSLVYDVRTSHCEADN
jgi:hypothetical protein